MYLLHLESQFLEPVLVPRCGIDNDALSSPLSQDVAVGVGSRGQRCGSNQYALDTRTVLESVRARGRVDC